MHFCDAESICHYNRVIKVQKAWTLVVYVCVYIHRKEVVEWDYCKSHNFFLALFRLSDAKKKLQLKCNHRGDTDKRI